MSQLKLSSIYKHKINQKSIKRQKINFEYLISNILNILIFYYNNQRIKCKINPLSNIGQLKLKYLL